MKLSKKVIIYAIALLIVVIYLFSANYIFNVLLKTGKEAKLSNISLPIETQEIKCNVEEVKIKKLRWKDAVIMNGWVFRKNVKNEKREAYLVLKSIKSTLIFKIENANISRPDIIKIFQMDGSVWNHGFYIAIPLYFLKEKNYQIGFVIVDETGKYFSLSHLELGMLNGGVEIFGYNSGIETEYIFHHKSFDIQKATQKIIFNFEKVEKTEKSVTVFGWGFLDGMSTNSLKSFILLKKGETIHVFDVVKQKRIEVTGQFGKIGLNMDSSGFQAQIHTAEMEPGQYQLGLYLVQDDHRGITYSDKYIKIGQ